jgi:hypothetical protein
MLDDLSFINNINSEYTNCLFTFVQDDTDNDVYYIHNSIDNVRTSVEFNLQEINNRKSYMGVSVVDEVNNYLEYELRANILELYH